MFNHFYSVSTQNYKLLNSIVGVLVSFKMLSIFVKMMLMSMKHSLGMKMKKMMMMAMLKMTGNYCY